MTCGFVAQVSKPAVSPISKSAGRYLPVGVALLLGAGAAFAQTNLPNASTVIEVMRRANNYWTNNFPLGDNSWEYGTYYAGNQRAGRLLGNTNYLNRSLIWAATNAWDIPGTDSVDSLASGQTYFDHYRMDSEPIRIADFQQRIDATVASGLVDQWSWIDAYFMAAPGFARLGNLYGDTDYFSKSFLMYDDMKHRRGLFDPIAGLWYRDGPSIYPAAQTASGNKVFWAQGNGWMIAGLARVLEQMPTNAPHRAEYVSMLQTMAAALKPLQGGDGLWRSSLLEPSQFPNPETSGTALFTYAMAWGVRKGILSAANYTNTIALAWRGMTNLALQASGQVGYVQLTGGAPANPAANDTAAQGVGAFLLACSELYLLAPGAVAVSPWAGADAIIVDQNQDGAEAVTLDASGTEVFLGPASFTWRRNGVLLATEMTTEVFLPVGTNVITLQVTGGNSVTYTARVVKAVIQLPASNRDFRSVASGNWNSASTWQTNNGTAWFPAIVPPGSADGVIAIRDGDTVTVNAAATADQVTIALGAQVIVNSGVTWTINDSTSGSDLTINGLLSVDGTLAGVSAPQVAVNGTIINTGTISGIGSADLVYNANGVYVHARDGGTVPAATWNTDSLCEITGITTTAPAGLAQVFHHFAWNCPGQATNVTLGSQPTAVNGDFAIYDTDGFALIGVTGNGVWTLDVGGDFILADGTFNFSTGTGGTLAMNLAGAFLQIGGTFTCSNAVSTLSLNFDGPGSTFERYGGTFSTARINFNVADDASLTLYNDVEVASGRTFTVSAARGTLLCGTNRLTGAGSFTLNAGATLSLGDPSGITTSPTLAGNIQVTGTRSFASGANYVYSGSAAQATGNGLPATVNDLTIANGAGVALFGSRTVNGMLSLWAGALSIGANTLTNNGAIAANGGSLVGGAASSINFGGNGPAATLPGLTLTNLTLNRANGLYLSGTVTVNGTLTFSNGKITTGTNRVNVANSLSTAISGANSSRYVHGILQKAFLTGSQSFNFPIGDLAHYTPISLGAMTVTTAGSLTASTTSAEHPNLTASGLNAAENVNRYWTLTPVGLAASSYNVTNTFAGADMDAGANTASFVVRRFDGTNWFATTTGARTATSTAGIGLTGFRDYVVGENAIDRYTVAAASPQNVGVPFTVTVTAQDRFGQTVTGDTNTLVLHSGTGSVVFDSNDDGIFGDNAKSLSSGVLAITARDSVAETISITATDANSKSGTLTGLVIVGSTPVGAYRSAGSGQWVSAATWQTNNGVAWFAASAAPTVAASTITISNGHTVTVSTSAFADQLIVRAGGRLVVNNNQTLTLGDGVGADLEVLGTVVNAGTITPNPGATIAFQAGGKYEHNYTATAGTIPTAIWATGSTCEILGYTSNAATPGGLGQNFRHFIWNCPGQATTIGLGAAFTNVSGNFTVTNTGSGDITLEGDLAVAGAASVGAQASVNCGASVITGPAFTLSSGATLGIGSATGIAATGASGNIQTTARSFSTNASYAYNGTVAQVTGGGLPSTVTNLTIANIVGSGTTLSGNVSVKGACVVNAGATLTLGTAIVSGPGTFTLNAGATLGIGDPNGITATGASGNIRNTGTRTFSPGASFSYNGSVAQVTGNGLPATVNHLTIQNLNGVTLVGSPTVSGSLILTTGKVVTAAHQIDLEAAATVSGAGAANYVNGRLRKAFNAGSNQSFSFPVGNAVAYMPVTLAAMDVVTAGTLTLTNTPGDHPGIATNGLNSGKSVNRYWSFAPGGGLAISSYNVTFNYVAGDVDVGANTAAFVVRRFNGTNWFATTTGARTPTSTQATGVNSLSVFAVGENTIRHYAVSAASPQSVSAPFLTTVTAEDLFNQTVTAQSGTAVTLSGTGSVQFDADENGIFGDNTRTLTNGTFSIVTRDFVAETVNLTATDATSKTGTLFGLVIGGNSPVGAYRSVASGNWTTAATWQTNNGAVWTNASAAPTAANAGTVTIRSGHTVTVAAPTSVDQVMVEAGGQITVNGSQTLTIANSPGADLAVSGVVRNAGTIALNSGATVVFEFGGKYQHNFTGSAGTIPTATWATGSTCEIIGYTSSTVGPVGLGQSFHHFIWNCTNQTANPGVPLSSSFTTVNGDFTVLRTGGGSSALFLSVNTAAALDVAGNFTQSGGRFKISGNSAHSAMTVQGSVSLLSGTLEMSTQAGVGNGNGTGTLNVAGDFFIGPGAVLTETSPNAGAGLVFFSGTSPQNLTNSGAISNTIHFTVNSGATVFLGTNRITGNGNFTNRAGATLCIGDPNGIAAPGIPSGNVQNTGTRSFDPGANYLFNGTAGQISGEGFPAVVNHLVIANPAGVALNSVVTVNGLCLVESGALLRGTGTISGTVIVEAGGTLSPGASVGTLTVNGTLDLAGNTVMEINKTGAVLSSDLVAGMSTLTCGGALTVVASGDALAANNAFNLFDSASMAGSFTTVTLPALSGCLTWDTSTLMVDGMIRVAPCASQLIVTGQVELQSFIGTNRTVTFVATGGVSNKTWTVALDFIGSSPKLAAYTLEDAPPGTTAMSAKTGLNLRRRIGVVFSGNAAVANFTGANNLLGGDLDGSNRVTTSDYSILKAVWLQTNPVADVDGSGRVTTSDYSILKANWLTQGDAL